MKTFNQIYLESLDPARAALILQNYQALVAIGSAQENQVLAKQLLTAAMHTGLPIDTQIMLWGWPADLVMKMRDINGYAYVPAYGQANINIAPGLSMPGVPSNYSVVAPPGSIKVSSDPSDYPPFQAPVVVVVPVVPTVGPFEQSGVGTDGLFHYYFGVVPGDTSRVGTQVTQDGQSYTKVPVTTGGFMGIGPTTMILWQLNLPARPATTN